MEIYSNSILLLPQIKDTESLRAYMFRVAQINAYPRLYTQGSTIYDSAAIFMKLVANRDPGLQGRLENRLAPPHTVMDINPPLRLGEEWIPSKYVLIRSRRVCPLCLRGSAWSRSEWELKSFTACPRHRVELASRCNSCNRNLTWNTTELLHCFCGHTLATIKTKPAAGYEVRWAQQIKLAVSFSIQGKATCKNKPTLESMRLSKLLLMSEVVKELVLARHSTRQGDARHQRQLLLQILVDDCFRRYLWEMMFLHAAGDPFSFTSKLQLGQGLGDLHHNYSQLISDLAVPHALIHGPSPVKTRCRIQEWRDHVLNIRRFYRNRVIAGANPFDPEFARQAGELL